MITDVKRLVLTCTRTFKIEKCDSPSRLTSVLTWSSRLLSQHLSSGTFQRPSLIFLSYSRPSLWPGHTLHSNHFVGLCKCTSSTSSHWMIFINNILVPPLKTSVKQIKGIIKLPQAALMKEINSDCFRCLTPALTLLFVLTRPTHSSKVASRMSVVVPHHSVPFDQAWLPSFFLLPPFLPSSKDGSRQKCSSQSYVFFTAHAGIG